MKVVIILTLIGVAFGRDLTLGASYTKGTKVFEEHATAGPAIWRQIRKITVKTNDTDVISRIAVNDLRPDKNGDVSIIDGGLGQKNVTIEVKSPTVFRGYDFQVEVYAVPEDEYESVNKTGVEKHPLQLIQNTHNERPVIDVKDSIPENNNEGPALHAKHLIPENNKEVPVHDVKGSKPYAPNFWLPIDA